MRVQFNKLVLTLAAAGLITGLAGCGGGGSPSGAVLPPAPQSTAAATAYRIEFIDAVTGQPVKEALTVRFSGASITDSEVRQPVVDGSGQYPAITASTSITTTDGLLTVLAFFNGTNDSFKVSASGGNWLVASAEVVPGSSTSITVRLMKSTTSTTDYVAAAEIGNASNGQVAAVDVTVNTASINIPDATTARRADGTPVAAGALTVAVVKFALGTDPLPLTSTMQGGSFSLGDKVGVTRFSITDSTGAEISKFSTPVTLGINLPAGSTFPVTGAPLDGTEVTYPISYYDEALKQWVPHTSKGTVSKNPDNSFTVTFESNHLSLWTLNPSYNPATSCIVSTLNLTGRPPGDTTPLTLRIQGGSFDKTIGPFTDSSLSLLYAPLGDVTLTVTAPSGVTVSPSTSNLCSPTTNSVELSGLVPPTPATLTVNVTETCSNDPSVSRVLPTSVYYQYQLSTGLLTTLGGWTGDDGSIAIGSVPLNTSGELKIWNPYRSGGAGYDYPQDPTGSGSYTINQVAKTLNYDIPVTCQIVTGSGSTQP